MNAIAQSVLSDLGPLAFSVLALLFFSSISVWIVFLLKTLSLLRGLYLQKKAIKLLERFPRQEELRLRFAAMPDNPLKELFETSDEELSNFLKSSPMAGHHRRGELMELLERTMEAKILMAEKGLQRGQAVLATISVTAPFLGLFGTVIGVIDTFQSIAEMNSVDLAVISPGLAEALIATAAGLFAAIPAALSYNLFRALIRSMTETMDYFALQLLRRMQHSLLSVNEKV